MKVVIPLAGTGKRLRPFTYTQPKPMIPVAGKPIIGHIVDELLSQGFDDFVFILGYLGNSIRQYIDKRYPELTCAFVQQDERKGLGHAIWMAREEMHGAEGVLIVLGDLIFQHDFKDMLKSKVSQLVIAPVEDPREFGVVDQDRDGRVVRTIEKPRIPKSNKALVGIYRIIETDQLIHALDTIISENRMTQGEFQLTDALQLMIEDGVTFNTCEVGQWFDCGRSDILLQTNALLLKHQDSPQKPNVDFTDSVIIPPVYIGVDCQIIGSIIGPFTTIGDGTDVSSSVVSNSIIGNETSIEYVVLHDSIIGNDSTVRGFKQRLNIGDDTVIDLFQKK
jgi:glucose-1-phosphate thymidylyltransferase